MTGAAPLCMHVQRRTAVRAILSLQLMRRRRMADPLLGTAETLRSLACHSAPPVPALRR